MRFLLGKKKKDSGAYVDLAQFGLLPRFGGERQSRSVVLQGRQSNIRIYHINRGLQITLLLGRL